LLTKIVLAGAVAKLLEVDDAFQSLHFGFFGGEVLILLGKSVFIFCFKLVYLVLILHEKLLVLRLGFFFLIDHFLGEFLAEVVHFCEEFLLAIHLIRAFRTSSYLRS
jgi:hypothetical protein